MGSLHEQSAYTTVPMTILETLTIPEGVLYENHDNLAVLNSDAGLAVATKSDPNQLTERTEDGEETITTSMAEYSPSMGAECSTQRPILPIIQKIFNLSSSIQILKKEHSVLSNQLKASLSPNSDILAGIRLVGNQYVALQKRFLDESMERKRLYNEVIELKGNIRVFCRCRPLSQAEVASGSSSVVEFDPMQDNELQIVSSDSSKKQFRFDRAFNPDDTQETVFAETKPIITSVLDGYNVCIFAYGQTGTGKTFTMEGNSESRGVNYRALEELFQISSQRSNFMRYMLSVSMLEVYNDKIRDLLAETTTDQPCKRLEIKQASDGSQEVPGLVETVVSGTDEVWDLLKLGSKTRSVGATGGNELSSRSHCLVRVTVKGENLIDGNNTKSRLWLVDLAGSERVGKIEVEGERLKESQFINKSLSALGDVISALASKTGHVPYRNSKLTHILQSSLGGDCKTLMFVQVSPSASDIGETICSLNFATRVRGIENGPARKHSDLSEMYKYKQMVEKLKHDEKETKKLQDNVQSLQLKLAAKDHVCRNFQEKVKELEHQIGEERKARLRQEQRFAAAAAAAQSARDTEKQKAERKPPLAPPKLRQPLRRITNFGPPQVPYNTPKFLANALSQASSNHGKENASRIALGSVPTNLMQPRRASIAVKPPTQSSSKQVFLPKRRVSIASLRPEHNPSPAQSSKQLPLPRRRVSIAALRPEMNPQFTTPLHTSASRLAGNTMGRPSLIPRKAVRYSKLFSPLPEFVSAPEVAATPMAVRSSQRFMGTPPTQTGSLQARHPTVVALQRKSLVWSPLKIRTMQPNRKPSLMPYRPPI